MKHKIPTFATEKTAGTSLRVGIVRAKWNDEYTSSLYRGCVKALKERGVTQKNIVAIDVPGSYEVVYGAKHLIDSAQVDAVICLGVLIKGETMHFEYISEAVAHGIMELNVDDGVPVVFGVLTCLTEEQAKVRSIGKHNHGIGWGATAVEMGLLRKSKVASLKS